MPAPKSRSAEIAVIRTAQPRTDYHAVVGATERRLPGALEVPIEQVVPDPEQPRRDWKHDEGERRLQELAASIREFGVLQPLVVREDGTLPDGRQRYLVVAGGRRRAAAELAGVTTIPVVVTGEEPMRARVIQLLENLQRQDLSPIDEGHAYQELIDLRNIKPPEVASLVHVSAQHVRDLLRLLADQVLADAVARRQISATAARDIRKLPDDEMMVFRQRVLSGEHLQTNDIARARARLAAAGVVNPRRKTARSTQATSWNGAAPGPGTSTTPSGIQEKQTTFVPAGPISHSTDSFAGVEKQTSFVPQLAPNAYPDARPPSANPSAYDEAVIDIGISVDSDAAAPESDTDNLHAVAMVALAALDAEARSQVIGLIEAAGHLGWTCTTLAAFLRRST